MKKIIVLLTILFSLNIFAQDSLQTKFTFAQRSGAFAPRILKQLGKDAHTAEFTARLKYKGYFFSTFVSKDLNEITGTGIENSAGNSLLFMTGKNLTFGKWSVAPRVGLFQPLGSDYLNPRINKATLIPNIFLRYRPSVNSSIGLWLNYFSNFSGKGSAFIMRADYTKKYKGIGKLQLVANYNDGLGGKSRVVNGGLHFSTLPRLISKKIAMYFDIYNYYNLIEFGDNPFTQNAFGIGIVFTTQ